MQRKVTMTGDKTPEWKTRHYTIIQKRRGGKCGQCGKRMYSL